MNRLNQFAATLYPNWWRDRYGAEFDALLHEARPNLFSTIDILKGAIAMQLSTWTPLRLIALCGIAGLLLGFGTTRLRTYTYESNGYLELAYPNTRDKAGIEKAANSAVAEWELTQLIGAYRLYPDSVGKLAKKDLARQMREAINFSWVSPGTGWNLDRLDVLKVTFAYSDPVKAQQVVEAINNRAVYWSDRVPAGTNPPMWHGAHQLSHPTLPKSQPFSDRWNATLAGLAAGTILGAILAGLNGRQRGQQPPAAPAFEPQLA